MIVAKVLMSSSLGKLLDSLTRLSQFRAHCKTWLTSEKKHDSVISILGAVSILSKPNQQDLYQKYLN
jgi:hypothetical protein